MSVPIFGVDFGTVNSAVSFFKNGEFVVIPNNEGDTISPSVIFFDPYSAEILFGNTASKLTGNFSNLKRLIGKTLPLEPELGNLFKNNEIIGGELSFGEELSFKIPYNNGQLVMSVSELITIYIKFLKSYACEFVGINKNETVDIVVTIPAYYNDFQREITKDCCQKAGCNVLRIINEPTSAALAYIYRGITEELNSGYVLVFDCGGGTTDLSLLYMDYVEQVYEVKSVVGNNYLGGEDLTELLTNHFLKLIPEEILNQKNQNKVKKCCENIKKELSFSLNAVLSLELGDKDYNFPISQAQFKFITSSFFQKIKTLIQSLNVTVDIEKIIFVGGTTRIPYFKDIFYSLFDVEVNCELDPDQTVSLGAAVQGALLKNLFETDNKFGETLLMDVVPLSIGVETLGGIMCQIVSRNTPIPISRTKELTNSDESNSIDISIYQGERRLVKDNFFLADFKLSEIPEAEKGTHIIQVTFTIDSDSIITVSAKLKNETTTNEIKITKDKTKIVINKNLEEILLDAENNKLYDSEIGSKILNKIELYDSFKYLLSVFHEKRDLILEGMQEDENFLFVELNKLFNKTFEIINNFEDYSSVSLKECKEQFEARWHSLLFDSGPIFKTEDGLIMEMGSTTID